MTFLDVALDCLSRGWYVFPCKPQSKEPLIRGAFHAASNDEAQIRAWWTRTPNANVAMAPCKSGLAVLDIDCGLRDAEDLRLFCIAKGLPATYTIRTGRRVHKDGPAFGVQLYYAGESIKSIAWEDIEDPSVSGDIRCSTGYVLVAGSVHPDSGETYEVLIDAPVAPVPAYVGQLKPKPITRDGQANGAITDDGVSPIADHRNNHMISLLGKRRYVGADDDEIQRYAVEVNDTRMRPPMGEDELERIVQNACKYAVGEPLPKVTIGAWREPNPDEFEEVQTSVRPEYPDGVWAGTAYAEFADYCAAGNYIPKRFFSEALRTIVGAVVGNQLSTDYQGVNARAYTVLIGPPGSGKGTAIAAARDFVGAEFDSQQRSTERPLLWDDHHDPESWCWPSRYIGAHVVSPASAPGLIQATKPSKLEKGQSRNPLELWRDIPRFVTIQEEIGGLFANFANENSGRGLETAILELFDRDSFTTTSTNERSAKSGRLLYSVLGGIPKIEWDNIFARSSSVGSGLFSRLNIVGTENERTVAGLPTYDFAEMQRRFLPRISALERTPARIPLSPNGRALLNEWFTRISTELKDKEIPSARLNLHALRTALHLAWLHGHANILESDVDAGIKVADFQARMREFYLPAEGESRDAVWEARILKVMKQKRSLSHRELQKLAHASRAGTTVWARAVAGLRKDGQIALVDETTKSGKTVSVVKLLKLKD